MILKPIMKKKSLKKYDAFFLNNCGYKAHNAFKDYHKCFLTINIDFFRNNYLFFCWINLIDISKSALYN